MSDTTKKSTLRVTSKDSLDEALNQLGSKQHELETLRLDLRKRKLPLEAKIHRIEEEVNPQIAALEKEIEALTEQSISYVKDHRSFLFGDGNTAELIYGKIVVKANPPSCHIDDEQMDSVIEALRRMDLGELIRTKISIDRHAIRRHREAVEQIRGIEFVQDERIILTPALSGADITARLAA